MLYGNRFLSENYGYFNEGSRFKDFFKSLSIPKELKLGDDDIRSAAKFKSKSVKLIKYMEDNDFTEGKIANTVLTFYYAILGTTFANGINSDEKYEPKLQFYATLANKYCDEDQKARIKQDIEQTITALNNRETLTPLQKAWMADIKSVVNKF